MVSLCPSGKPQVILHCVPSRECFQNRLDGVISCLPTSLPLAFRTKSKHLFVLVLPFLSHFLLHLPSPKTHKYMCAHIHMHTHTPVGWVRCTNYKVPIIEFIWSNYFNYYLNPPLNCEISRDCVIVIFFLHMVNCVKCSKLKCTAWWIFICACVRVTSTLTESDREHFRQPRGSLTVLRDLPGPCLFTYKLPGNMRATWR